MVGMSPDQVLGPRGTPRPSPPCRALRLLLEETPEVLPPPRESGARTAEDTHGGRPSCDQVLTDRVPIRTPLDTSLSQAWAPVAPPRDQDATPPAFVSRSSPV